MTFGGYVNGSRVDEVIKFKHEGANIVAEHVSGGELCTHGPAARASFSVGVAQDKTVYLFGGQEDDNRKLNDIWSFDTNKFEWTKIEVAPEDYSPKHRSGHSTCVFGNKMYIFGGIIELTHELNDLVTFDFETKKFSSNYETEEVESAEKIFKENDDKSPTVKSGTLGSPLKRNKTTV
jgi:hypothetical protein